MSRLHSFLVFVVVFVVLCFAMSTQSLSLKKNDDGTFLIAVGCYSSGNGSLSFYTFNPEMYDDNTSFQLLSTADGGDSPSYVVVGQRNTGDDELKLYTLQEVGDGKVSSYDVDAVSSSSPVATQMNQKSSEGYGPAFISLDNTKQFLFVANYADSQKASIAVLPIDSNSGELQSAVYTQEFKVNGWAHQILVDASNTYVFVVMKGEDRIIQYVLDASSGQLSENGNGAECPFPSGSGPRHMAFHPSNNQVAYLVTELASTVSTLAYNPWQGTMSIVQTVSSLPDDFSGYNTGAEIRVHPLGQYVYVSNRGANTIAVFKIDSSTGLLVTPAIQFISTAGNTPRIFEIERSNGAYLVVANQDSNNIVAFSIDTQTGLLTQMGEPTVIPYGAVPFVGFV